MFIIFLITIFFWIYSFIVFSIQKKSIEFQKKIIIELGLNLKNHNQKVIVSQELRVKMKNSNDILKAKIIDINMEMFIELFVKKV